MALAPLNLKQPNQTHQLPLDLRRQKNSALYFFRAQSVPKHPINHFKLPVSLRRFYAARPSHMLPFCERAKMILHDSDLNNVSVQFSDFFTFPPWEIPQFSPLRGTSSPVPAFWTFTNWLPRGATVGHLSSDCTEQEKCVNCKGSHTSYSRFCPVWKTEKEIVAVKVKEQVSYPEARRIVKARTPTPGISYSSVVRGKLISTGIQYDLQDLNPGSSANVSDQIVESETSQLGMKRRGHSLGLALRVVTVPGGDSQRIGSG
ncbi:hypothetical protein AVEN_233545-1 [Araneus ventricosus]|uniref:Uncharacterized protein n=1 Tax=Araneus ventricosus TaxID=182803 RepID=A0A4Y2NEP1_ARAVE|nr:hypothetical protein AVEN_233545-1 [Araneus ventricosus]